MRRQRGEARHAEAPTLLRTSSRAQAAGFKSQFVGSSLFTNFGLAWRWPEDHGSCVDRLLIVGGLELRLGVPGEGEDLLDDVVQMIHFS